MVLGLRATNRRGDSVKIDYLIHLQEIKPWPPSQSLRSLRSVLIQWDNGDRLSGSTSQVVPTIGSVVGEGKIEFNESFKLPVTLVSDGSVKNRDSDAFQRNCLEFNLYEPRRDKTVKGHLLASAIIDLADYGIVRDTISITVPMNCKRSFKNTDQPILFIKIQPIDKRRNGSSPRDKLSRGTSMDSNAGESVSALMTEQYAEEHEGVFSTDDDVSSHSSLTVPSSTSEPSGSLPSQSEENGPGRMAHSIEGSREGHALVSELGPEKSNVMQENGAQRNLKASSSFSSSIDLYSDCGSPVNGHASISSSYNHGSMPILKNSSSHSVTSSPLLFHEKLVDDSQAIMRNEDHEHLTQDICEKNANDQDYQEEAATTPDVYNRSIEDEDGKSEHESRHHEQLATHDAVGNQVLPGGDTLSLGRGNLGTKSDIVKSDRIKHVKSVRSPLDSVRSNGSTNSQQLREANTVVSFRTNERKEAKIYLKDTRNAILDSKIEKLQQRIQMLEGELREAAAIEAALYSVVAEHGSSMSKVHAPARRLSRLYLHSCRETTLSRRGSAARTAVSGLVLIAKACGNDVPRLTFWLSNSIVLRTIISRATGDLLTRSAGIHIERNGGNNTSSQLKWKASSLRQKEEKSIMYGSVGDWEDPHTFTSALEKVEAWIFSRTIESLWWQTLTPHMQSAAAKAIDKVSSPGSGKNCKRMSSSNDQEQVNFSLDLWKKAFTDACERICPVRAGGHDCGCLPLLARLVMEQCVARLDVAMFNAILRESADDIPTDPVSDPISEPKVLPIPAGITSFGSGAQLKTAIGNWCRWLTDLFGINGDDRLEDEDDNDDGEDTSFKSFHLLNALSDLMMLPKDLLLSRSIRKEVCPTFGSPLIRRILDNFSPDEFCPDPIPDVVLEALNSEDPLETDGDSIANFPCSASPIVYMPPSAALVAEIIGDGGSNPELRRSGSSLLRKSYTSDDELDELNSPLASIFMDTPRSVSSSPTKLSWISRENKNQNALRYELLRDVWRNSA